MPPFFNFCILALNSTQRREHRRSREDAGTPRGAGGWDRKVWRQPGRRTIAADALRHTWPLSHRSARTRENCSGAKRRAWWRYSRSPIARRTWTNSSEGEDRRTPLKTHSAVCSFYLLTVGTKDGGWVWGRGGGHRRRGGSKNSKLLIVPDRGCRGGEAAQCSARGAPKVSWEA